MAAYAALVSLMHIVDQIQHHPRPPISLDKKQVESLTEKVTFLQDFLESYSINSGSEEYKDGLESRIADAAYAAEDVMGSHIGDQVLAGSTSATNEENISSIDLYEGLQKVMQDMDLIKRDVTAVKEKIGIQLHSMSMSVGSSRSPPTGKNTMVGFEDIKIEIMDKLTGQQTNHHIIPIVGMGGIGKTTLARNIYLDPLVKHHFDILAWAIVSQEYNAKEILLKVLVCLETVGSLETLNGMSEYELGEILHRSLVGRRYLIVMDDIWSVEAWYEVKFFFPDNNNGSRILITTRLSNLAFELTGTFGLKMNFLDEDNSWNLLCKIVFGEEDFPIELEEIGKKIAKKCNGLPLSLVVIGGLLAKSKPTRVYWQHIAENLNSIVNLEDNERCLKILLMSYDQLPVHLKPCFLYMGMFMEDCEIRVPNLIKAWVAEGFLKPINGKTLEVVAEEYLNDLIERNLILAIRRGPAGKIKLCIIHDLLRDLCEREAEKQKFLCARRLHNLSIYTIRRVAAYHLSPDVFDPLYSASLAHAFVCNNSKGLPVSKFRLLGVLNGFKKGSGNHECSCSSEDIFQLINTRYLATRLNWIHPYMHGFPSSVYLLWNLQVLIVLDKCRLTAPFEIWKMPQLRHVQLDSLHLSDPTDNVVLGNLQTLSTIRNFQLSEEVVTRIPNVKKLKTYFDGPPEVSRSCLHNLGRLHKLESLSLNWSVVSEVRRSELLQDLVSFPHSLKKLTLEGCHLHWEDISTKIGPLPLLQVLKLRLWSFVGPEWETVEGQFGSLKFLLVEMCHDLEYWKTDSTHFPQLEHLVLRALHGLKEIPWGIGDIPTLQSIQLDCCSDSAVISARQILEEQEELGNVGLQVRVRLWNKNRALESLAGPNFQVKIRDGYLNEERTN